MVFLQARLIAVSHADIFIPDDSIWLDSDGEKI